MPCTKRFRVLKFDSLPRRRSQFQHGQFTVFILILTLKLRRDICLMPRAGNAGHFRHQGLVGVYGVVRIFVDAIKRVAHPILKFGNRNTAVAVAVNAGKILLTTLKRLIRTEQNRLMILFTQAGLRYQKGFGTHYLHTKNWECRILGLP